MFLKWGLLLAKLGPLKVGSAQDQEPSGDQKDHNQECYKFGVLGCKEMYLLFQGLDSGCTCDIHVTHVTHVCCHLNHTHLSPVLPILPDL